MTRKITPSSAPVERLNEPLSTEDVVRGVLTGSSLPITSMLRRGKTHRRCVCREEEGDKHISFFDVNMQRYEFQGFCPDCTTMFAEKLPTWMFPGSKERKTFLTLRTVYEVFSLFKGTYWWRGILEKDTTNLTREARMLLWASTGLPFEESYSLKSLREFMETPTSEDGLRRLRNFICTIDGTMIAVTLAGFGIEEVNNWYFFDKAARSIYLNSLPDLYKLEEGSTFYGRLKKIKGDLKNVLLKERKSMELELSDRTEFWFLQPILSTFSERLTPEDICRLGILTQTRAVGIAPQPLIVEAIRKFIATVRETPEPLTKQQIVELRLGTFEVYLDLLSEVKGNMDALLMEAAKEFKVSLSNSGCFTHSRRKGGKVEAARILIQEGEPVTEIYDLHTGLSKGFARNEDLTPGEILLYRSLKKMIDWELDKTNPEFRDPYQVRVSVVTEQGKARVVSLSTIEHSCVLHPLSHVLKVVLSASPKLRSGLTAGNHLWNFYKDIQKKDIPRDGIFRFPEGPGKDHQVFEEWDNPRSTFLASEDWSEATDRFHPASARLILYEIVKLLRLPKWYSEMAARALTTPRVTYVPTKYFLGRDYEALKKDFEPFTPERGEGEMIAFVKARGIFMGDPGTKPVLSLGHLVCEVIARRRLQKIGTGSSYPPLQTEASFTFGSIPFVFGRKGFRSGSKEEQESMVRRVMYPPMGPHKRFDPGELSQAVKEFFPEGFEPKSQ